MDKYIELGTHHGLESILNIKSLGKLCEDVQEHFPDHFEAVRTYAMGSSCAVQDIWWLAYSNRTTPQRDSYSIP